MQNGVLRNFTKFTGKQLCQSLFLVKLQASVFLIELLTFPDEGAAKINGTNRNHFLKNISVVIVNL